jgi:hypothetical protein
MLLGRLMLWPVVCSQLYLACSEGWGCGSMASLDTVNQCQILAENRGVLFRGSICQNRAGRTPGVHDSRGFTSGLGSV